MRSNIYDRLLNRETNGATKHSNVRALYGDRAWIRDLDIVNELHGHAGCVNALSWSKNGQLLASGSDDQHLNIHSYQPESTTLPFSLTTTVSTGHSANIFSVKFMPHSNDRTLVTAAGDDEIRIFDIEYSGRSAIPSEDASTGRSQGFLHHGTRYLSTGDTNAKVFRSHSDRVKRIVTESSPFFFLSCSEDGEVRQWDLRLPSSAYPRARGGRGWRSTAQDDDTGVPPPLISYKRHRLDLNTISCSPSQPHYIALGGAHLHCFLHDRRMLGRDRMMERGASVSSSGYSEHDDNVMSEATQCVRRFAPGGQQRMKRTDSGHITACKISDANPNEIVVSWSGEWIYSFDVIRSPDAEEHVPERVSSSETRRRHIDSRGGKDRKRKRTQAGSCTSQEGATRVGSKPRTSSLRAGHGDHVSLRVRYENGQSEDLSIGNAEQHDAFSETSPASGNDGLSIADASLQIHKHMFGPPNGEPNNPYDTVLEFSASILPVMDKIDRTWQYPMNPDADEVLLQRNLRMNRQSARRFVQGCGTVARLIGGTFPDLVSVDDLRQRIAAFASIFPAPNEIDIADATEQFSYDFVKAIVLWLYSGPGALVEGFSRPTDRQQGETRFPIRGGASIEAIDDTLIPYLLRLAGTRSIPDVTTSRFEVDTNRKVFQTEQAAVLAFASAVQMPFADLSQAVVSVPPTASSTIERPTVQDRARALKFWGDKVARGVLLNAGHRLSYAFVDQAYGGQGMPDARIQQEERDLRRQLQDIDTQTERVALIANSNYAISDPAQPDDSDQGDATSVESDDEEQEEEEEEDQEGADEMQDASNFLYSSSFERSRARENVQADVPCNSHIRKYTGHCNVKTVKDVNFFGLNDEYVVSGSDSGHVFIWDRVTSELLNILEGDGEVVNVVQGHPYEPTLAVSGIDHTIKIFSPDARARRDARRGVGVAAADPLTFSSVRHPFGVRRRRPAPPRAERVEQQAAEMDSEPAVPRPPSETESDDGRQPGDVIVASSGLSSRKRMHLSYQITAQNDVDRQGGNRQAFITQDMLAQLLGRIRMQRAAATAGEGTDAEGARMFVHDGDNDADDGEGGMYVRVEDCSLM